MDPCVLVGRSGLLGQLAKTKNNWFVVNFLSVSHVSTSSRSGAEMGRGTRYESYSSHTRRNHQPVILLLAHLPGPPRNKIRSRSLVESATTWRCSKVMMMAAGCFLILDLEFQDSGVPGCSWVPTCGCGELIWGADDSLILTGFYRFL